ncbi:MAG: hypothetical protein ACRDCW_06785 [Sarcina sp.]
MLRSFGLLYMVDNTNEIQPGAIQHTDKVYYICSADNEIYEVLNGEVVKTADFDFLKPKQQEDKLVFVESKLMKKVDTLEKRITFLLSLVSDKIIPPELLGGEE